MKIKSEEWLLFKEKILKVFDILGHDAVNLQVSDEPEDFDIIINDCIIHPIFIKKPEELKVQYDLTLCETRIRTLSFSMYKDAARIEVTLKKKD